MDILALNNQEKTTSFMSGTRQMTHHLEVYQIKLKKDTTNKNPLESEQP